jgi:hypothetical protein
VGSEQRSQTLVALARPVKQPPDHPPFALPERRLPIARKQFGDAAARRLLDLGIRIAERHAEAQRQPPAYRRLPRTHESNDDQTAAMKIGRDVHVSARFGIV